MNAETAAKKIEKAYNKIASKPGAPISIYDIWASIIDVDMTHAELTEGIRYLALNGEKVYVDPESNQKMLTPEQREARVFLFGQHKDIIYIG